MDMEEEKRIIDDILKKRRLSYSIEILDVQGDKYTVRNNFGSTIVYIKKGDNYFVEQDKE
ncbi:MAG: hypothetical protein ACFE8L_01910 [Candidatus Hodarchaeota archaeon]